MRDDVDWARVLAYFHYITSRSNKMIYLTTAEGRAYDAVIGQVWTQGGWTTAHTKQLGQILQVLAFGCDDQWQT